MALDNTLARQLASAVRAGAAKKEKQTEARGVAQIICGKPHVVLNGSTVATPVETTVTVNEGDELLVAIENHRAMVLGNITSNAVDNATFYKRLSDGSLNIAVNNLDIAADGGIKLSAGAMLTVLAGAGVNLNDMLVIDPETNSCTLNVTSFSLGGSENITDIEDLKGADGAPGTDVTSQWVKFFWSGFYAGLNLVSDDGVSGVHANINNGAFSILEDLHTMIKMASFKVNSEYNHSYIAAPDGVKITTKEPGETGYATKPFVFVDDQAAYTNNGPIIGGELDGTTLYLYCDVLGGA